MIVFVDAQWFGVFFLFFPLQMMSYESFIFQNLFLVGCLYECWRWLLGDVLFECTQHSHFSQQES